MESGEGTAVGKAYLVDFPGRLVVSAPGLGFFFFFCRCQVSGGLHMLLVAVAGSKRKGCGGLGQGWFPVPEWESSGNGGGSAKYGPCGVSG